jgi:hypothetical protein
MDFGRVFSRAWEISWNNKYLFILGFLAALGGGAGGSRPQFNYSFSGGNLPPDFEQNIERAIATALPLILAAGCLALFVGLIFWLIRLTAQAGLISATWRLDTGEKVRFGEAFSAGTGYLPRMLGINILLFGPFWLIGLVGLAIFIASFGAYFTALPDTGGGGPLGALGGAFALVGLCAAVVACLLIPVWVIVAVVYAFAQRGAVVQDLDVVGSIRHGWNVVTENVGDVLLLVIFFLVLGIVFGIVVSLLLLPLGFLAVGPAFLSMLRGSVGVGDVVYLVVGGIVVGLLAAVLNSLLVTYRSVAVTLAYEQFTGAKEVVVP